MLAKCGVFNAKAEMLYRVIAQWYLHKRVYTVNSNLAHTVYLCVLL
jgi:hypothetical protein